MNRKTLPQVLLVCLVLMLVVTAAPTLFTRYASTPSPTDRLSVAWNNLRAASTTEQTVQRAWLLAQVSGAYNFHAELEQTTYYPPALTNVGRSAQVDHLYLEGRTDAKNETLQLALWQGGSVLRPADALEMRIEKGKAYSRAAIGEWQEVNDFSGVFAPAQDPLAYLHGAKDMREITLSGANYRQFSFAADGPAFAEYMRQQLEDELRRSGKLPPNITLDTARIYHDMLGTGQLWLTSDSLPLRLEMAVEFPQQSDGSRVKATIRTDFSNFAKLDVDAYNKTPLMGVMLNRATPPALANLAARLWLTDWSALAKELVLILMVSALMLAMVIFQRRRRVYAAVSLMVIASMVLTPLMESQRAYAFSQDQAAASQKYQAQQAEQQAQHDLQARLLNSWDGTQNPLASAEARAQLAQTAPAVPLTLTSRTSPAAMLSLASTAASSVDANGDGVPDDQEPSACLVASKGTDCDGDGLTNLQEYRLGTRLASPDSDGDGLSDYMEVTGFGATSKTQSGKWYANPNSADTNMDGLPDNMECWTDNTFNSIKSALPSNVPCDKDSNNDGVPDLFAQDNDGDGVDDARDLSPFNVSTTTYDKSNYFPLQVNGLLPNEPLFVDIQLAPTNRNQISYSRNVLDWPSGDTNGQVQRTTDTTFADLMSTAQRAADTGAANGDMRLVPLIEVRIPAADTNNLLPRTQTITTTRSATGYNQVTIGSGADAKTELQIWLRAQIEFRAQNGSTTLAFTNLKDNNGAALTVDRVNLFNTPHCPVSPDAMPQYTKATSTATGDTWPLSAALPALLDGGHVIMLEQGSGDTQKTTCLPLGDVPNGKLPAGWMFDTAKLDAYGVNLRDVDADWSAAYVPANVVVGRTGGEKQAFAARIPYWPGNVSSLGTTQEVRLVWMVQLLDDDGQIQIIHTYANESWKLAGLATRQDIEVRNAVFYQNPDYAGNDTSVNNLQSRLIQVATVLDGYFMAKPLGQPRLTWTRQTTSNELITQLISRVPNLQSYLPSDSIKVELRTYETQDEIARIPAEVTPGVLGRFINNGAYKAGYDHALLLFAREEVYKSVTWNGGGNVLSLPASPDTLAAYSWKPFHYTDAKWEDYPVSEYMDLHRVHIQDALNATNPPALSQAGADRADTLEGMALALQSYALGLIHGDSRLVQLASQPIEREDNKLLGDVGDIVGNGTGLLLQSLASEVVENFVEPILERGSGIGAFKAVANALKNSTNTLLGRPVQPGVRSSFQVRGSMGSIVLGGAVVGLTFAAAFSGNETAGDALKVVIATSQVALGALGLVMQVQDAIKAVKDAGGSLKAAMSAADAVSRATKIGLVIGIVLAAVGAAIMFAVTVGLGGFGIADLRFTAAVATMAAQIVAAVIMAAIGLIPIVGQILVAIIALIDAVIGAICAVSKAAGYDLEERTKAEIPGSGGAEVSLCKGINGFVTSAVQWAIFSQNVLVGNMQDADRLKTSNFMLGMVNANQGFQVGNALNPTVRVDNQIELIDQPIDWKSAVYFWQINWDILDNATHRYDLTVDKTNRNVDLSEMESEWQELGSNGQLTGGHRSPGIQYDDPLHMIPTTAQLAQDTAAISFNQSGINVPTTLYLREAYANPTQECFAVPLPPFFYPIPICYIRKDAGTNHIDMQLAFDVFPETLDKFYQPMSKGGGCSLAWGQEGNITFPVMMDFDGDGLRGPAYGGNDPNDCKWDTDGDGLNDLFEMQKGTNPNLADSDGDGLDDQQELLFGANPNRADGDGDGLFDGEEVFHKLTAINWSGGWEFVYDLINGIPQKTWVTSDPSQLDGDGDTLTDYQEKLYGLNPRVKSDPAILKLDSQVREANAPSLLLRFEEHASANLFGDVSGLLNNATCTGASCPAAGYAGKYTNGLMFDGVDDQIVGRGSVSLANASFTVAAWVARANTLTTDQFIFSNGTGQNNQGLHIGFRNNQFMCAFWYNDLMTPAQYADTNWHHWACTYNATNRQRAIYRDGILVAQDTASANYQGSGDWHIGAVFNGTSFFGGMLDEVAVFPVALDALQIQSVRDARYNPGSTPLSVKGGESLTYDATLTNNLLGKQLTGLLWTQAPPAWSKAELPATFQLAPAQSKMLQGNVTVANTAASGAYSLTLRAGAAASDPQPQPEPPPPPPPPYNYPSGPWMYLPFERTFNDASGNGRNAGPFGGRPSFQQGFKGQGFNFNRETSDYVMVPGGVASSYTDFTFAAWVYWRGGTEWQRIFDFGSNSDNFMMFTPWDQWGQTRFDIKKGGTVQTLATAGDVMPHNTWTHVAVVLNSSTNSGKIYINGVDRTNYADAITIRPYTIAGANSRLGGPDKWNNWYTYFNGMLDEVFVYQRALSAREVQQLALSGVTARANFPTNPAPRVYLPFDGHYLDYRDNDEAKGGGLPGYTTNLQGQAFVAGRQNEALNLNDWNHVNSPNSIEWVKLPSFVANSDQFTFMAWVYWRGGDAWQRIFDFGKSSDDYIMLTPSDGDGKIRIEMRQGGGYYKYALWDQPFPVNTWVHVAVNYDRNDQNGTAHIFFNGVRDQVGFRNFGYSLKDIAGDHSFLGLSNHDDPLFNGMLDEVYIFHSVLQERDIQALMKAGVTDEHFSFENPEPLAYSPNRYATTAPYLYAKAPAGATFTPGIDGKQALALTASTVQATAPAFNMSGTDFTYSIWVKPDPNNSAGKRTILSQPEQGVVGPALLMKDGTDVKFQWSGSQYWPYSDADGWYTNQLRPGAWNHIAVTFINSGANAGTLTLYVNGESLPSQNTGTRRPPVTYSFAFGSNFYGAVDELRIHRRAYNAAEIRALYAEYATPYVFPLDEPPGAGLNSSVFNFKNYGSRVSTLIQGTCMPGSCPTSGVPGRVNQAVQFQANQSIQIANLDLQAGAPGFSIWVNPSADGQVFQIRQPGSYNTVVRRAGNAFCIAASDQETCSTTAYPSGQWYHLMVRFDSGVSRLYINGQYGGGAWDNWRGAGQYGVTLGGGFSGLLDDFRIPYNGGVAAITQMAAAAPLGLLHLDERGKVTSFVNVGGATATCSGALCPIGGQKGRVGQAARFDGIDDGLSIPHSAALNLSAYTLAAWVKPMAGQNASGLQTLVAKADGDYRNYALYLTQDRRIYTSQFCGGTHLQLTSVNPLALDLYTHVVVTYDGNRMVLYINGTPQDSVATGAVNCSNNAPLTLGKPYNGAYRAFNGDLDEIQLYGYALSAAQIKAIFSTEVNWIEEENAYNVLVDADYPTSSLNGWTLNSSQYYSNADVQLAVTGNDSTTRVALLEIGISRENSSSVWTAAEACQDAQGGTASGSPAWCPWFKPTSAGGEGRYTIQTRATDRVGNRETPAGNYAILVDATRPNLIVNQANGSLQTLRSHPSQAHAQVLTLDGTVSDPALNSVSGAAGSGVGGVWVTLRDADGKVVGNAPYPAQVNGTTWTLNYPFLQEQVAGPYSLLVAASDKVGNSTTLPARTLYLDGTAPGVELGEAASGLPLTKTTASFVTANTTLRGVVSERPFPSGAQAAYHFEENLGATTFSNAVASSGWGAPGNATCSGATCPTAGSAGRIGRGLLFDGTNDALISNAATSLTNSSLSVAIWAKRSNTLTTDQWVFASGTGQTNQGLHLGFRNNQFMCAFWFNDLLTPAVYADTNWHHWVCTYNAITRQRAIYRDGTRVAQDTTTANYQGSGNGYIGSRFDNSGYFSGLLDEVAVYARALSADEVRVLAAPQVSGLQSAAVSFTPLWADPASGAISPYLVQSLVSQTLYLPLDDARDQNQNITFRNLANPAAPANCWGDTCPTPGERSPVGPSVNFERQNDYIFLPAGMPRSDNFSFAAWVYWRGGYAILFDTSGPTNQLSLRIANSGLASFAVMYNSQSQVVWGPTLPHHTWVHLALSCQGTGCVIYLNGVAAAQGTITHRLSQAAGNIWTFGQLLNGQLSDVRTFSRGLSAAEVQSVWRGSRALISLPLDDNFAMDGSVLPDASSWNRTALLNTGPGDTANKAMPGINGPYALKLDGANDQIVIADSPDLRLDRFTLSLWVNPAQIKSDWQPLLIKSDANSSNRNYALFLVPNTNQVHYFVNKADCTANAMANTNTALPLNAWSHVALTYDGTSLNLYINGTLDSTTPLTGGLCQRPNAVRSGWLENAFTAFNGLLDQVEIYPRALLATEIADLAQTRWRTVIVSGEQTDWNLPIHVGLEGVYGLDLRGVDAANPNHYSFNTQAVAPNQTIDSLPPRAALTRQMGGNWNTQYHYVFAAQDLYLSKTGLSTPCGNSGTTVETSRLDPANGQMVLTRLTVECTLPQRPSTETATVCDVGGNCRTVNATLAARDSQPVGPFGAPLDNAQLDKPAAAVQPIGQVPDPLWVQSAAKPVEASVVPIRWNSAIPQNEAASHPAQPDLSMPLMPWANVTVTNTADSGPGSLRAAIASAAPGDTIIFDVGLSGQTITLTSMLTIDKNLTIDGSALAAPISLSGNDTVRVFYVNGGVTAELNALKVMHGYTVSPEEGAGLINYGTLTVTHSTFDSNVSGRQGGGIQNNGTLAVKDSTFSNNQVPNANMCGAGINNGGVLNVSSSTFINNFAGDCGAGISGGGSSIDVANSTFTGNTAEGWRGGGGVFFNGTVIAVTNSTFFSNTASGGPGGGISLENPSVVLNLNNTIIADSTGGDCYNPGSLGIAQNNLIQNSGSACGLTNGVSGNLIGSNPNLGPLADNGGRTQTMALLPGSPAIDTGDDAICAAAPVNNLDQRGVTRPQNTHCDIGAYEYILQSGCFTEYTGDNITDFSSADASAVQSALAVVPPGGTVKIAGYCPGVQANGGTIQTARVDQVVTLAGGYTSTNWTTSYPLTQPTTLDAQGGGRVIYANAATTLINLTLQNGAGDNHGGGAYFAYVPATITGVTFISNTAVGNGGGAAFFDLATISNTTFVSNTAGAFGGGIYVRLTANLTGSTFTGNTSALDGGGAYLSGGATVVGTAFTGNTSSGQYGGGAAFNNAANVINTTFADNAAQYGGGAYFSGAYAGELVNGLFARNRAALNGAAMFVADAAPLSLVHTTIVSPTQSSVSAVYLEGGTVYLTNTIVASHTTGIRNQFGGAVTAWSPLFFGNSVNTYGAVTVNNPVLDDPAFVTPASDNYHLTAVSAAINAGTTPGPNVASDIAGDVRPQQGGYDIGYDETPFNTPPVITPTASVGGSISPATLQRIAYGSSITFTITPDTGYFILDVLVDDSSVGAVNQYVFGNVTTTHSISATFDVLTLPDTYLNTWPPNPSYDITATFTFSSPDATATFECQLDGAGFAPCVSPWTYTNLSYITHTFQVRAVNLSGEFDPTPATYSWLVENAPIPGTFEFTDLPGVITTLPATVTIKGRVAPPNSLTNLVVAIDQTPILSETYPAGTIVSHIFQAGWSPTRSGAHLLTAQATDALSGTATISATLFVDIAPPQAVLNSNTYTSTHYSPHTGLTFNGVASDTTGIVSATAFLDLGSGLIPLGLAFDETTPPAGYLNGQAVYSRTVWNATWWELDNLPNNVAGTLYLTLDDPTHAPITYTYPVTLDVVPPDFGNVVITANGTPITTGLTYTSSLLDTAVYIPPVTDGSVVSLWYGWTEVYTATLADLTQAVDPSVALTVTHSFTRSVADGGTARFFHIQALDAYGNARTATFGPYYHDLPGMPDYISTPEMSDGFTSGAYRAWQTNSCTLQGVDRRIANQGLTGAALSGNQSFYLTWNNDRLHFVWQGANWATDGDLFIYLDTIPDQAGPYQQVGGSVAYNPYASTYSSTVVLLPTEEWSNNPNFVPPAGVPAVNGMHADYALWVKDNTNAYLLRWDNIGNQWVISGSLSDLGGAYALHTQVDGTVTDLIVPLALVDNPQNWSAPFSGLGPTGMGVVALAVDAPEGPSGGLRLWSVLPYANPADSARVVPNAPAADQPHLMMLTDRYIVPIVDGACFQPEGRLTFHMTADVDRFAYNGFEDSIRLVLPAPSVNPNAWNGLFDPYDDVFRAWLAADYCPTHPTYPACHASKPPAELSVADLLATRIDSQHPPLLPGSSVTYTLYYVNPSETLTTTLAYLYSNNHLNDPQSGVAFAGQSWASDCQGWLSLQLPAGAGWLVLTGTVQSAGVSTVTLDIAPSYSLGAGCAVVPGEGSWPGYRLNVQHTPDDGAPAYVAIQPNFTIAGPISATIPGVVQDASPVSQIEIQVNGGARFSCTDTTPTDGQWNCPWDIPASNGGVVPTNGATFSLRARATDAFGHTSAWSDPQTVQIDTQAPQFGAGSSNDLLSLAAPGVLTPTLISDPVIYLSGVISDNTRPQSVEVCDAAGQNCASASLEIDPYSVPPTAYSYKDVLTIPVTIDNNAGCGSGTIGLVRTFNITDSFTIGGLQVGLRLMHPYRSDLSARLRSPVGTEVTLFSYTKNVLAENVNALFTDQSLARLPDDQFSHDLDADVDYARRTYRPQNSLSAFGGQNAAGAWTLMLCDRDPASDTGEFYAAELDFAAITPPLNVTGDWTYRFDASGSDGTAYAWQLYATDVNGNPTAQPYSLTMQVDNVAPIITATQTVTQLLVANSAEVLHGAVTDGDIVSTTWVLVIDPLGNSTVESVVGEPAAWTYTFTPTLGGEYKFAVYAVDRAGNQAGVGTFSLTAMQPLEIAQTVTPEYNVQAGSLVTYTIWVYNYNAQETANNVVITTTLSPWLTPVNTGGAILSQTLPDNLLVWQPTSLAAGAVLSLTVIARMPDKLLVVTPNPITGILPITTTYVITDQVDLHGARFTSQTRLTTDNLGASQAYACNFVAASLQKIYVPLVMRNYVAAPDLVVQRILATSNNVQVVIKNQGGRPVEDEFWVDVYINPTPPPTHVNQTWNMLGNRGLTWGVTWPALSALTSGGVLTLTVGDAYYYPDLSRITWPLTMATPVYAQVDSANAGSWYGAVLENHEIIGQLYNNISQTIFTSGTSNVIIPPVAHSSQSAPATGSPPRRP